MNLTQITGPTIEPLTLDEAREFLRISPDEHSEDALIAAMIYAARITLEAATNRAFITQTWQMGLDGFWTVTPRRWVAGLDAFWGVIRLPKSPTQSVTSIQYVDTAGNTQTLATSFYQVDLLTKPARIAPAFGIVWPPIRPVFNSVLITFKAGYGDQRDSIPEPLRIAMRILVSTMWENRESFVVGVMPSELLPFGVAQLIANHRIPVYG